MSGVLIRTHTHTHDNTVLPEVPCEIERRSHCAIQRSFQPEEQVLGIVCTTDTMATSRCQFMLKSVLEHLAFFLWKYISMPHSSIPSTFIRSMMGISLNLCQISELTLAKLCILHHKVEKDTFYVYHNYKFHSKADFQAINQISDTRAQMKLIETGGVWVGNPNWRNMFPFMPNRVSWRSFDWACIPFLKASLKLFKVLGTMVG